METLLVLLGLALLAVPIGVILLWIGQSNLRRRVAELEMRLAEALAGRALHPQMPADAAPPAPLPVEQPAIPSPWDRAKAAVAPVAATVQADAPPLPDMAPPDQNRPLVIRAETAARLMVWLRENWVYAVSALSLALAGVFFVQYGVERGLLPPPARVAAAILFGLALIGAGEWLRRRWGDAAGTATAYLPSVFSGAGLVAVFAGITAGRLMYGLYGPGLTFAGLVLTALGAIGLGWRHGPLLVAIGLIGAAVTPFLVAGGGDAAPWLYGYYLLIAATGLAVDAIRRWAWVSVLALGLGYVGTALMAQLGAGDAGWLAALLALALLAITVPQRSLIPDHEGPCVAMALWRRDGIWPGFPVRLAAGAVVATSVGLTLVGAEGTLALLAFALLAGLCLLLLLWADRAEGLADLAGVPALAFLAKLAVAEGLIWEFGAQAIALRPPETDAPWTVTILLGLATVVSLGAALRAFRGGVMALPMALGAVLVAPVAALLLELLWQPAPVIGAYPWALQVIALAGLMVGFALRFAGLDAGNHRRAAWATLSALSLMALALFLITSAAALTLALAVLLIVAAALDRRFDLPEMGWFLQAGSALISYRLIADPGLDWALYAPLTPALLAYGGAALAAFVALRLLPEARILPRGVLESAGFAFAALTANVALTRALLPEDPSLHPDWTQSHWGLALNALPWLILMLTQLHRAALGGLLRPLRLGLAALAGLLAAGGFALAVGPVNPLFSTWAEDAAMLVRGPLVFDSLALAYVVPGLMLLIAAHKLALPRQLRLVFLGLGAALVTLYAGLEIRRLWQGDWLGAPGVKQGELYSYTVAMLLTGAALLWQALARRDLRLQRIAMAVIALTVAKVFLLDAAGLTGLTRVVSFAGLGLSLAGLAWLNRWAKGAMSEPRDGT